MPPLPDAVVLEDGAGGLPMVRVHHSRGEAVISLQGGQVLSWVPSGHEPVLWTSPLARFGEGQAIRGGVPICFPWFGAGREEPEMTPSHGFARIAPFRLVEARADSGAVVVRLDLGGDDVATAPGRDRWQHDFVLSVTVTVGESLRIEVAVTNRSDRVISYEEALHTYLAVGDVREVTVTGLDGAPYVDKTTRPWSARDQHGDVRIERETDRVYGTRSPVTVRDGAMGRRIHVARESSADAVVWNPWESAPDDVGEHWPGFLCVEAANVLHDGVVLAPGESHTMASTYAVERDRPGRLRPSRGLP